MTEFVRLLPKLCYPPASMGNFYGNYTVKGATQRAVAAALSRRRALVTPESQGCVVVFDEESDTQGVDVLAELGAHISSRLHLPVLAVLNHDDAILFYRLFEDGSQTDEYCSHPGYFSGEDLPPDGGDAATLCAAFGNGNIEEVKAILHPANGKRPVFAVQQHEELVRALDLPDYAIGAGYTYVIEGDLPPELLDRDLMRPE